jgi:ankyrin repeat protein
MNIFLVLFVVAWLAHYFSLNRAIADNDIRIVRLVVKMGFNVNSRSGLTSWTPLHFAAANGNKEISELLISGGANLNTKDKDGNTPLEYALTMKHKEVARLLIDRGAEVNNCTLNSAALAGNKEIVELLLKKGLNVNSPCPPYTSTLGSAIIKDHDGVVELLLDHGAALNPKETNFLSTPLHAAASIHAEKTANLLISKGAKINATDERGHTPLYYATEKEDISMQRLLINAGAIRK